MRRGQDALIRLQVDLAESMTGTTREVQVDTAVRCEACQGAGTAPDTRPATCPMCKGHGEIQNVQRSFLGQVMTATELRQALSRLPVINEFDLIRIELPGTGNFWSWQREGVADSTSNWSLAIPLLCNDGSLIGRMVLERDLRRGAPVIEAGTLCETLAREVGRALERVKGVDSAPFTHRNTNPSGTG